MKIVLVAVIAAAALALAALAAMTPGRADASGWHRCAPVLFHTGYSRAAGIYRIRKFGHITCAETRRVAAFTMRLARDPAGWYCDSYAEDIAAVECRNGRAAIRFAPDYAD